MRLQRAAGKGRIVHDDLHAFSTGGILFVNNGALRKERVSDGILFANSSKKYAVGDKIRLLPQRYAAGGNKRKSYWEQWAAGGKSL